MAPHIRPQETVDLGLHLSDLGIPDRDIAVICGVAIKTVRRWRRLYQRRGIPRFGRRGERANASPCPKCNGAPLDSVAYSHLLGWYLGDGHIVDAGRGQLRLEIVSDARYLRLLDEIADSMRAVRGGTSPFRHIRIGCVGIAMYWNHWPCVFPQHGPGLKHNRPIVLEDWQRAIVEQHPGPFLRGLFHSDGCRFTNWTVQTVAGVRKRYEYPRYQFSNRSTDILELCSWALALVGVEHRWPKPIHISIARREAVARLDEFVGPKS